MIKQLFLILICALLPNLVFAFDGDYVWEEKFNKQLPKAEQGDSKAQYAVGEMYESGKGTTKDTSTAFKWYVKSAKQGHKKAIFKVGLSYLKGIGVARNNDKALKWLNRSADKGYERAHFYLGEMYELGKGVNKDLDVALNWYQQALNEGYARAEERVARVRLAINKLSKSQIKAKRKAEAVAARKQLAAKAKAVPVSIKEHPLSTSQTLLQGNWKKKNKPVEYLPSKVSKCKNTGPTIECMSKESTRSIGVADINYTTKAILYSLKDTGEFKISYRNNVTKIDIKDADFAASGAKVPVKLGWQDAEHSLVCKIKSNKKIVCKKDKIRTIKFNR